MSERRKNLTGIFVCVIAAIVVMALIVAAVHILRPIIFKRSLPSSGGEFELQTEDSLVLKQFTMEEILADERITFNQSLMLINAKNLLDDDFEADVGEYKDTGVIMNNCIMDAYAELAAKVKELFDQKLYISSSYRTKEKQAQVLADNKDVAAQVGASEHQAGLALDVYVRYYAGMGFISSKAGQYVNENCGEFGFIIRYPSFGEKITGITYEPWHIRYVGMPHSKIIQDSRITLEEYMDGLANGEYYKYDDYIIFRQTGEAVLMPQNFESAVVSPDNFGGYIFTVKRCN